MDMNKFEEMIIDYLDGNLQGADKESFEEKLNSSEECMEMFEQYRSIREVSGSEEDLEPPVEIIESVRQHVRENVKQEKKPFYEKFLKLPVLAPTLAVAIIAMLWVSAGEDYLKNRNIIPESESSASNELKTEYRANAGKLKEDKVIIEEERLADNEVTTNLSKSQDATDAQAVAKITSAPATEKKKQAFTAKPSGQDNSIDSTTSLVRQQTSIKSPAAEINEPELKDVTAKSSQTIGSSLSRSTKTTSSGSPSERVVIANNYRNELNEIVTLQYKGDCRESLSRAQKLLDADPEPSVSIKTDLYVTQGECFMELKQYDKALEVYEKAKELTPHKSYLFNGKIKEAYIQQGNQ